MSRIIGVTVGTPMSVNKIKEKINPVTSDELKSAVETALQEAKDSGMFDGPKGDTPEKGTDYWTASDKAAMVSDVLAALPTWTGGSY